MSHLSCFFLAHWFGSSLRLLSSSTRKQGETEGVIISAGPNTFFGHVAFLFSQDDDTTGHLQKIPARINSFCLVIIGTFVLLEILFLYPAYH